MVVFNIDDNAHEIWKKHLKMKRQRKKRMAKTISPKARTFDLDSHRINITT